MNKQDDSIGSVKISRLGKKPTETMYSDGDVEDEILQLFKDGLSSDKRDEILRNDPSWAVRYHLAYQRGNLLNWYKFKKDSRVLEVGSGCGAITEVLVDNEVTVVANELSERRATINAHRNKHAQNLEIVIGNLQDYKPKEKFDYVVCVGVLEYAGTFIDSSKPYDEFVSLLKSFLKPNGVILIAIENKLGFKYLSGAKEDHTGGYFDGINNYPQKKDVRTFGRQELTELVNRNGLNVERFYYPHPDYKIPEVVYSDNFLPGIHTLLPNTLLPSPNFDQERQHLFSEANFVMSLEANNVFATFANSFLVECVADDATPTPSNVVFSINRFSRDSKYQIQTSGILDGDKVLIRKTAATDKSNDHINKMVDTYVKLGQKYIDNEKFGFAPPKNIDTKTGTVEFDYIPGHSAEELLLRSIIEEDYDLANNIITKFKDILDTLSTNTSTKKSVKELESLFGEEITKEFNINKNIKEGLLDLNLDNFIIHKDTHKWWLIDYEWRLDVPIPVEFIEYRSMLSFAFKNRSIITSRCNRQSIWSNNILAIPQKILEDNNYELEKLNIAYKIENSHFQPWVSGKKTEFEMPGEYSNPTLEPYFIEQAHKKINDDSRELNEVRTKLGHTEAHVQNLEKHISRIETSKTYKIASRLASLKRIVKRILHVFRRK